MTTFSKSNFKALNYNSFRPHYPGSFYKVLSQYVTKGDSSKLPISKSIDLGCGTGVNTYPLLNISHEVIGLDLSAKMVEIADSLAQERTKELNVDSNRISFKTGAVEDVLYDEPRQIPDESIDLITAAQCIHWFQDFPKFFVSASKLLKPQGTLAYFFYVDPVIVDFHGGSVSSKSKTEILARANQVYRDYMYNDKDYVGPYWEQPGRNILRDLCVEVNASVPKDIFEDVTVNTFLPNYETGQITAGENDLDLKKVGISIEDYFDYLRTYSGYHNFKDKTGDQLDVFGKLLDVFVNELGWDKANTKVDLVWNTGYTFIRKK